MLTLTDYDNTNGDAAKIYVDDVSDATVISVGGVDLTDYLKGVSVLVGEGGGGSYFLADTFGESFVDVALCAVDTPLYADSDKETF